MSEYTCRFGEKFKKKCGRTCGYIDTPNFRCHNAVDPETISEEMTFEKFEMLYKDKTEVSKEDVYKLIEQYEKLIDDLLLQLNFTKTELNIYKVTY